MYVYCLLGSRGAGGGSVSEVMGVDWITLRGAAGGVTMSSVAVSSTLRGGIGTNGTKIGVWLIGGSAVGWILEVLVGLVSSWFMFFSRETLDGVSVAKVEYRVVLRRSEIISRTPAAIISLEMAMGSYRCLGN